MQQGDIVDPTVREVVRELSPELQKEVIDDVPHHAHTE